MPEKPIWTDIPLTQDIPSYPHPDAPYPLGDTVFEHTESAIPSASTTFSGSREQDCFLCLYSGSTCFLAMLEGRIIAARERTIHGKPLPFITVHVEKIRRPNAEVQTVSYIASIALKEYYHHLVKELRARNLDLTEHHIRVRIYHLPDAYAVKDFKNESIYHYQAQTHTAVILEPDLLLNITDLAQADYCSRQYLLNRLVSTPPSAATIRGNLIHFCFKELLKSGDPVRRTQNQFSADEVSPIDEPLAFLRKTLDKALQHYKLDLQLAAISQAAIVEEVMPHLESLAVWYAREHSTLWTQLETSDGKLTSGVRAETFLLTPEIGLRGRLDLFWQQHNRQQFLELKTGNTTRALPKSDHQQQVRGYYAQLTARRDQKMQKAQAMVVYSGTPHCAEAYRIPFEIRNFHRINETRNLLVLSHVTGTPSAPPGPSRCTKCSMLIQCQRISAALDWQPPQTEINLREQISPPPSQENIVSPPTQHENTEITRLNAATAETPSTVSTTAATPQERPLDTEEDRAFFAHYYRLLQLEGRASDSQQARLWRESLEERTARGAVITNLRAIAIEPTPQGEWEQTFACENSSELRRGDEILLSDGDPIRGEVVTGTITAISATSVTLWTPERIATPRQIDRYDNDLVHVRTVQNLMRWLDADPRLRDLVAGRIRPRFRQEQVAPRADFNQQQQQAVERAMQMRDYLLIQGPPGTGKTSVIAEIVKRFMERGQRVLLAAFTNQAVDNMLKRLAEKERVRTFIRLGHERSIDEYPLIQERLLQNLLLAPPEKSGMPAGCNARDMLRIAPIIASTTATWSSDKYSPYLLDGIAGELPFDVAIIDEASQLTVPALLGALRFARSFILVGDDKQLPPLVQNKAVAVEQKDQVRPEGLATSLFELLKEQDVAYLEAGGEESACVSLRTQYRMHERIAHFSSRVFYEGKLVAGEQNKRAILEVPPILAGEPSIVTQALRPIHPLVFVNVLEHDARQMKVSEKEAETVGALVHGLLARGIAPSEIGIIAPYRAQVAALRHHLFSEEQLARWPTIHRKQHGETSLTIDTVDRFQGGERQVMIISFATQRMPQGDLRDFLTNPNRLNVALTRAQRKLILVGALPILEQLPIFKRLVTYCRNMNTIINV